MGNPALLGKAIRNVLSNGALYSPPGAALNISAYRDDRMAMVTVENGGVHLDPEVLPHLFEAFYRADPSRSRQTGGSGLGLYLVKIILNQHGAVGEILNTAQESASKCSSLWRPRQICRKKPAWSARNPTDAGQKRENS